MNLVWFLTIAAVASIGLGEFGRFPFGAASGIRLTDGLMLAVCLFLVIWQMAISRKIISPRSFGVMMFFWLIALVSILLSGNFLGLAYLTRFVFYSSGVWIGYSLIKSNVTNLEGLLRLEIGAGVGLVLLGAIQLLFMPDISYFSQFGYDPHQNRLVSSFLDPNYLGMLLSIDLFLVTYFWRGRNNWRVGGLISVFLLAILLTFSRTAYLMLVIGGVMLMTRFYKPGLVLIVLLGLGLYTLFPPFSARINGAIVVDKSASERIESWRDGWLAFESRPLIGVGFGNLRQFYEANNLVKVFSSDGGNSGNGNDSSIIFLLATTGIVGLISYLSFWFLVIRQLFTNDRFSYILLTIIVSLFIGSQFVNGWFYPPIMIGLFLLVGARLALNPAK